MADKEKNKKEKQAVEEIFDNKRSFLFDGEEYFIDQAGLDDIRAADWHYSRTYNEALLAGVATQDQMEDLLIEREIIGPKYEKKRIEIIEELNEIVAEMQAETDLVKKGILADKADEVRGKLFRWNRRASSPFSNSVEQMAEDARVEWLTSCMVKDSDGNKVWDDYESYKTTDKPLLAMRARYSVMLALQGMSESFMDETPEALVRKEIQEAENTKLLEEKEVSAEKPKAKKK